SQFSQELRIASSEDRKVSYIGGLFYQQSDLKFHDMFDVPVDSFIPTALVQQFGSAANLLRGASTERDFKQDTDLFSIFAQATWNITDTQRLTIGARWTDEDKSASRHHYHVTSEVILIDSPSPTEIYNHLWANFSIDPHKVKGSRSES